MSHNPSQYARFLQPHRRALLRLRLDLGFFLEESGPVLLVTVEQRIKSFESAVEKAQRLKLDLYELDDLAGLRVVSGTRIDAETLCHFFRNGLRGTSFKVLKDKPIARNDGYRAHHLVIEAAEDYTGTWQPCKIEIQVLTTLQDAFNRLSRAWLYKSGRDLPAELQAKFQAFSHGLEELDDLASDLQRHLLTTSEGSRDNDPLTPLAYQTIVREVFGEETDDENAIWHAIFYRRCGMQTCGDLRRFFGRSDISQFYDECRRCLQKDHYFWTLSTTRQEFWQTCGIRLDWAKKQVEAELQKARAGGENA
jgi:ppGpp synthetase/RelA/SpoT-type nucleotidyltranferase